MQSVGGKIDDVQIQSYRSKALTLLRNGKLALEGTWNLQWTTHLRQYLTILIMKADANYDRTLAIQTYLHFIRHLKDSFRHWTIFWIVLQRVRIVGLGIGLSELFLQIWNKTGCFYGQIWRRTRICQNIWPPMTFDTAKVRKFKMATKMAYFARKWLIFIQYWLYNMSFYRLFGSRNTNLELLTSVSVHG